MGKTHPFLLNWILRILNPRNFSKINLGAKVYPPRFTFERAKGIFISVTSLL